MKVNDHNFNKVSESDVVNYSSIYNSKLLKMKQVYEYHEQKSFSVSKEVIAKILVNEMSFIKNSEYDLSRLIDVMSLGVQS